MRAAAIWLEGDALAMVRLGNGAADGPWSVPEVTLEHGETLAEAAVRAMAELARTTALCGPFVGWAESIDPPEHHLTMFFDVVVLDVEHTGSPAPGVEVRSVPLWEVPELRLRPGLAEFLADQQIIDLVV